MRTRLSALACVLLAVVTLSAQDQSPREEQLPVFRTQADLVRVDMYATRNNTLVTDLRADEVEIYEDNVRQRIDTFELVRVPGTGGVAPGAPTDPVASDVRSRVFVVFLDTYSTRLQNNGDLRRSLIRFLDQLLGPTDLVGLMTPDMYASEVVLGRRSTVISDLANDDRWNRPDARRPDQNEFAWESCYPTSGDGRRAGNSSGGVGGGGGGGGSRRGAGDGDSFVGGDSAGRLPGDATVPPEDGYPGSGSRSTGGGGGSAGGGGGFGGAGGGGQLNEMKARYEGKATIEALADLVTHLRTLREERKAVLLVTAGWPFANSASSIPPGQYETDRCAKDRAALERIDFPALLRDISKTANRANVSFYPLNSRRVLEFPKTTSASFRQQMQQREKRTLETIQEQLQALASETDGLAEMKTTNLAAVTERILSDTSAYYLIGYRSANASKSDRRFHSITVKVNRPGLRIRSRPGYGGETVLVPRALIAASTAPRAPVVDARLQSALTAVERFDARAPFWSRSSSWNGPTGAGGAFWYVGELGLEMRLQPSWSAGAKAEVEVFAADRTRVMTQSIDLPPADSTFMIRVPAEGVLPAGDYSVRVRIKPAAEQGSPVQDALRVTLAAATPFGEPVLWRRGPSARMTYLETADPRFRRTERLRLDLPVPREGDIPTARLLDRTGKALAMAVEVGERADTSGDFRWLTVELPMISLAPGDYAIEVTGNETTRVTAFRVIP
jgi:VWFA-related protein